MDKHKEIVSELFKQVSFPVNPANSAHDLLGAKKIILYGAGDGFITFSVFVLRRYGFGAFIVLDRKFKKGDAHFGIPACSPDEYEPSREDRENAVVVVTVGKREYHQEIFSCLRVLGYENIVLASDIYEYHLHHSPAELEQKGFDYYLDNKMRIMACLDLFRDDLSLEIFTRFISTHLQRKPIQIPSRPLTEQYFPEDINLSKGYSRFISCGAYDGDTIRRLNALYGKVDTIACFEPDPENFAQLSGYLCAGHGKIAERIMAFPCGVFSQETLLHFSDGDRINSAISEKGGTFIQCVAMDHVMPGFNPTFISMDVEGAEREALRGAETLIKENRPDLAICVYHSPDHIWDIPLYLDGLRLGYRFYLRNYTSFISETVLYAVVEAE